MHDDKRGLRRRNCRWQCYCLNLHFSFTSTRGSYSQPENVECSEASIVKTTRSCTFGSIAAMQAAELPCTEQAHSQDADADADAEWYDITRHLKRKVAHSANEKIADDDIKETP
jgi:hypothetical protein